MEILIITFSSVSFRFLDSASMEIFALADVSKYFLVPSVTVKNRREKSTDGHAPLWWAAELELAGYIITNLFLNSVLNSKAHHQPMI